MLAKRKESERRREEEEARDKAEKEEKAERERREEVARKQADEEEAKRQRVVDENKRKWEEWNALKAAKEAKAKKDAEEEKARKTREAAEAARMEEEIRQRSQESLNALNGTSSGVTESAFPGEFYSAMGGATDFGDQGQFGGSSAGTSPASGTSYITSSTYYQQQGRQHALYHPRPAYPALLGSQGSSSPQPELHNLSSTSPYGNHEFRHPPHHHGVSTPIRNYPHMERPEGPRYMDLSGEYRTLANI